MTGLPALLRPWLPLLLLIVLGNLWGLSFSLSKLAALGGVHPFAYAWWQSSGAALFLTGILWWRGQPLTLDRQRAGFFLGAALIGLVLPNINIITTARYLPAGLMSTIVTTVPLIAYALALACNMERFSRRKSLGLLLGLVGVGFIVLPRSSLPAPDLVGWVLLALLTPALYAASAIFNARVRPTEMSALVAAWGMLSAASLTTAPLMFATGNFYPLFAAVNVADWALFGQILVSCLAYILYFEIIGRSGPVYVSQVGYVVNILGLFWGYIIFDERLSAWIWAAVGCVFLGLLLVNTRTREARGVAEQTA